MASSDLIAAQSLAEKGTGEGLPEPPPAGRDIMVEARIPPGLRAELESRLPGAMKASPANSPPWQALGWLWLHDGWLVNASGDFLLLGAKPVTSDRSLVAPIPLLSLGWTWRPDVNPEVAASTYSETLALWLDSLTGPGGPPGLEMLRERIHVEAGEGGRISGRIDLPPVLANHARPAWLLARQPRFAGGWLATDPAGLPEPGALDQLVPGKAFNVGNPGNRLLATWNLSDNFRRACFEVARERLEIAPGDQSPLGEAWPAVLDTMEAILSAFPAGSATVEYEDAEKILRLDARIPRGK